MDRLLTLDDLAAAFGCSPEHVRRLASRGELTGRKVAGKWRFKPEDVEDYLAKVATVDPWKRSAASRARRRRAA